jgi:hypothetical protein
MTTMLAPKLRFRDLLRPPYVPWWLSDRPDGQAPYPGPTTRNVGYRFLWTMAAILDCGMEYLYQGVQAAYPGWGTDTALPLIGQTRDILMGETETPAAYGARLRGWLEAHAQTGPIGLAQQLHYYLPGQPMVRIVDRSGNWVTVDASGNVTTLELGASSWDWDTVSNPERNVVGAPYWSDLWVIVYGTVDGQACYPIRPGTEGGLTGDDGYGWGFLIPHVSADNVRRIISRWKGAHSRVRDVIFTPSLEQFDPLTPAAGVWPNGTWGSWMYYSGGVASFPRDTTCRYLEPDYGAPT